MTPTEDIIWAAGFFDGEGCILIQSTAGGHLGGNTYQSLVCNMAQVDKGLLEEFQRIVGGVGLLTSHAGAGNGRDYWVWQVSAKKASTVLTLLLPFLKGKKAQAKTALEYRATYPDKPYGRWRSVPMEILGVRERLAQRVKALKFVGVEEGGCS